VRSGCGSLTVFDVSKTFGCGDALGSFRFFLVRLAMVNRSYFSVGCSRRFRPLSRQNIAYARASARALWHQIHKHDDWFNICTTGKCNCNPEVELWKDIGAGKP
jgi:hypothetical protein